jgi:hypothetical protein
MGEVTGARTARQLDVAVVADRTASWAAEQSGVPLVRELRLHWRGRKPLRDAVVGLAIEPGLAPARAIPLPEIEAGGTLTLRHPDLAFDPVKICELRERVHATLIVSVSAAQQMLAHVETPLDVLAMNEWDGDRLAELAAAFVLPDDPAVEEVLRRARSRQADLVGDLPSVEAIAAAFQELAAGWKVVPAGALLRFPSVVFAQKQASDFELALLFAALFERAGLGAWVVRFDGRTCAGAWLEEDHLPVAATDDPGIVTKLVASERIVLFDPTRLVSSTAPFSAAVDAAQARLDDREAFELALDVRAARLARIRPLPIHGSRRDGAPAPRPETARPAPATAAPPTARVRTRVDRWKEQLLDLTLRNRLLNFLPSRSRTLALDLPDLGDLEDRLQARPLAIAAQVALGGADPRARELVLERTPEGERRRALRDRLDRGELPTKHDAADLQRRLVSLWREARREVEETGTSTLELALGMLRWRPPYRVATGRSDGSCLAPILLVPVELARRASGNGYELRLRDDEPRVNETLLEKLRAELDLEIPGLDPLPTDEKGIDVAAVIKAFQGALARQRGFDVVEEAHVAFFSFHKFLLWRDLVDHEAELLRHDLVRHLVHGDRGKELLAGEPFVEPRDLDRERPLGASRLVLDADASQRVAIDAALRGRSFVLQGPPGTGKSQTIANLIAECLAAGKRVLFVAEKQAALEVVARRLERVGLGDLCLELHSQKASKREVIAELASLLDPPRARGSAGAAERGERAQEVTDLAVRLSAYADGLHRPTPLGRSHFECFERRLELAEAPRLDLEWGDVLAVDAATFTQRTQAVAALADAAAAVGVPAKSAWRACRPVEWTPLTQQSIEQALARFAKATDALNAACATWTAAFALPAELPLAALPALIELAKLAAAGAPPGAWSLLERRDLDAALERVDAAAQRANELAELAAHVATRFDAGLWKLDLQPLHDAFVRHGGKFAPLRWLVLRGPRAALARVARSTLPEPAIVSETLAAALRVQELRHELEAGRPFLADLFGSAATGALADGRALRAAAAFARNWRAAAAELAKHASHGSGPPKLRALESAVAQPLAQTLRAAHDEFGLARVQAQALLRFDDGAFAPLPPLVPTLAPTLADVARVVAAWRAALPELRDWTRFTQARAAAAAAGLDGFVAAALHAGIAPARWPETAERSFLDAWIVRALDARPEFKGFDARDHERHIAEFRAADVAWIAENGPRLAHALRRAATPAGSAAAVAESEVGLLKRQSVLKRRHLPVRRLLAELPNLLPRLKPCLLMSPLSIAQYLPPSSRKFDVVVFDEASQITVPDAVGALARGTQVVVVGDSRQLPPTAFFTVQTSGEEEGDGGEEAEAELPRTEEVESILDECVAANLPQLTLRWHYRSRHEQLIDFSNRHYYEGRLQTFPSAWTDRARFGVSLERVDGVFDRARSRTNRAEAEAIVAWIVAALRDPARRARSIGVVTFNSPQRELILDLLDDARAGHPEIEPWFSDAAPEPVFVKNLENVQGDERDVMLFSITYGPDPRGRILMNFGPLNVDGGERRLNVAITRAREQLVVFSSLDADAIDPSRTRAIGVDHLRRFLEYAAGEKGRRTAKGGDAPASLGPLSAAVADAFAEHGIALEAGVGASRLRVDLAWRDPQSDRYVAGILSDGPGYGAGETARDRDRLRDAVLEGLGWRLARVWSTEWIVDPKRELARLRARLDALRTAPPAAARAGANAKLLTDETDTAAPDDADPGDDEDAPVEAGDEAEAPAASDSPDSLEPWTPYVAPVEPPRVPADLADAASAAALLANIVREEGPVHEEPAFRTLAALHRVARLTPAVAAECTKVAEAAAARGALARRGEFLWPIGVDPEHAPLRGPAADGRVRHAPHVPVEERAAAAERVLAANVALPRGDLARAAAKLCGYSRATERVAALFDEGVQWLLDRGRAVAEGGRVRVP